MKVPKLKISGNTGFITNSSSAIYHFPKLVLEDEQVRTLLETYELFEGYVGRDLWSRSDCETLAVTKEQAQEVKDRLLEPGFGIPGVEVSDESIILIYGDEYESLTRVLADSMRQACEKLKLSYSDDEYN